MYFTTDELLQIWKLVYEECQAQSHWTSSLLIPLPNKGNLQFHQLRRYKLDVQKNITAWSWIESARSSMQNSERIKQALEPAEAAFNWFIFWDESWKELSCKTSRFSSHSSTSRKPSTQSTEPWCSLFYVTMAYRKE